MKNNLTALMFALLAPVVFGTHCTTYNSIPIDPKPDATITPGTDDDCKAACDNGRALKCEWAAPTAAGALCEDVCHNSETSGGYVTMNPRCLAKAPSCDAADACSNQ